MQNEKISDFYFRMRKWMISFSFCPILSILHFPLCLFCLRPRKWQRDAEIFSKSPKAQLRLVCQGELAQEQRKSLVLPDRGKAWGPRGGTTAFTNDIPGEGAAIGPQRKHQSCGPQRTPQDPDPPVSSSVPIARGDPQSSWSRPRTR